MQYCQSCGKILTVSCYGLKKYKINPVIFDFTPEGFTYIRLMKSFIPELSFAFLPNAPCLGNHRFYDMAYKNGYADYSLSLNPSLWKAAQTPSFFQ